jgi:hypothetical protein
MHGQVQKRVGFAIVGGDKLAMVSIASKATLLPALA